MEGTVDKPDVVLQHLVEEELLQDSGKAPSTCCGTQFCIAAFHTKSGIMAITF